MRNLLWEFLKKGLVLAAVLAYWVLDDLVIFLPDNVVDWIGKGVFTALMNGYRYEEFKAFWNKKKPETPAK